MAKKKKTKKKTKAQKPQKRKKRKVILTESECRVRFHQKILEVMNRHTEIECSGRGVDFDGNEYGYTEAEVVFREYGRSMRDLGLTCIPIEKTAVLGKTAYMIQAKYKLTDTDTGYSEIITGCGLGTNGQWAANTAQTLALKQALLETFGASWPQPEEYKDIVKKEAEKVFGQAETPEQVRQVLNDFFGNYPMKGKENGTERNSASGSPKGQSHRVGRKASGSKRN